MTNHSDHAHDHDHDHHGHGHHHGPATGGFRWRLVAAAGVLLLAVFTSTVVTVATGSAVVVTRFGDPVQVHLEPGLTWKLPPPIDRAMLVDLRLHTTSSGVHSVLTSDGLSVLVQVYAAWRVPAQSAAVLRYVRATGNDAATAANHLRTLLGSALETTTAHYAFSELLNTDPAAVRLADLGADLRQRLATQMAEVYGLEVVALGIERLQLPDTTMAATVERMAAERSTIAEEKKAYGRKVAGEIRAEADRDARIAQATANEAAARIEAVARTTAATIYSEVHQQDPELYRFLRSLDALDQIITATTRLVLRTDAAPFTSLVAPPAAAATPEPAP